MDTLLLRYSLTSNAAAPDCAIELRPELCPNQARPEVLPVCPNLGRLSELAGLAGGFREALRRALVSITEDDDGAGAGAVLDQTVRPAARSLAQVLLPPLILERLRRETIGHVVFDFDPRLNGIPFEACLVDDEFLCFRQATGRRLHSPRLGSLRGSDRLPARAFALVNPTQDLPAAVEAEYLRFAAAWVEEGRDRLIQFEHRISREFNRERLVEEVRSRDFLTLVCHHRDDTFALSPGGAAADGFSARDLWAAVGLHDVAPQLLFSVSCESGMASGWEQDWPDTQHLHGMLDASLRMGIRNFIGSWLEVPATLSARMIRGFYAALTDGYSVGEALRRARASLRAKPQDSHDGTTVVGLAFGLYGDPRSSHFCAEGHRVDPSRAVFCEASVGSGFCGRTVCRADAGFARSRCRLHEPPPAEAPRCFENHPIRAGVAYRCTDPARRHPREVRLLCPLDDGFHRRLCRECLEPCSSPIPPSWP